MAGAHPAQDMFDRSDAGLIADEIDAGLSGDSTHGQATLSPANTWVQIPGTAPTSPYILIIAKETVAGTVRFSFSNSGTPGSTVGLQLRANEFIVELGLSEVMYVASSNSGDTLNWTTKIIRD